jgi:hypothetical protein
VWREFDKDLHMRSVIAVPLRDSAGYRGTLALSWSEPRKIELFEVDFARTLTAALELLS